MKPVGLLDGNYLFQPYLHVYKYLGNVRVVWSNGAFPDAPKQGAPAPALKAAAVEVKDDLPF